MGCNVGYAVINIQSQMREEKRRIPPGDRRASLAVRPDTMSRQQRVDFAQGGPRRNSGDCVDLVHILEKQDIWTPQERNDDPRYEHSDPRTHEVGNRRMNQFINLGYINTMKKGRTRWQVLCRVLEKDDFLPENIDKEFLGRRSGITERGRLEQCKDGGLLYVAPRQLPVGQHVVIQVWMTWFLLIPTS